MCGPGSSIGARPFLYPPPGGEISLELKKREKEKGRQIQRSAVQKRKWRLAFV